MTIKKRQLQGPYRLTVNDQDLADEAGHLNSMEVEYDADAEISETLDEVELDDT